MDRGELTPELIEANIRAATHRKAAALAEYEAARDELEWWKQGRRLFGIQPPEEEAGTQAKVTEIFPPAKFFADGTQPTLRQAIVAVMGEQPGAHWRVADLASAILQHAWLREDAAKDAAKRVSDMAGIMVNDGQLVRPARGVYALAPDIAVSLEQALRLAGTSNQPSPAKGEG